MAFLFCAEMGRLNPWRSNLPPLEGGGEQAATFAFSRGPARRLLLVIKAQGADVVMKVVR